MDEILASIRRIISEDEASIVSTIPLATAAAAHDADDDEDDDVLVLTELAPPEPSAHHGLDIRALAEPADEGQALVARETALSAAASFDKLSFVVDSAHLTPAQPAPMASPTLEDITRDLLRPMLKSWLDQNLDAIVRARVDEEVERIARGRVR